MHSQLTEHGLIPTNRLSNAISVLKIHAMYFNDRRDKILGPHCEDIIWIRYPVSLDFWFLFLMCLMLIWTYLTCHLIFQIHFTVNWPIQPYLKGRGTAIVFISNPFHFYHLHNDFPTVQIALFF